MAVGWMADYPGRDIGEVEQSLANDRQGLGRDKRGVVDELLNLAKDTTNPFLS